MNEELSVKELLDDLCDVLGEITLLEEDKVYKAKIIDCDGSRLVNETPVERARMLSSAAMETYVMEIYEKLGYENK